VCGGPYVIMIEWRPQRGPRGTAGLEDGEEQEQEPGPRPRHPVAELERNDDEDEHPIDGPLGAGPVGRAGAGVVEDQTLQPAPPQQQ
jgi:hypothetical protein